MAAAAAQTPAIIPEGYTFIKPHQFVSRTAWDMAKSLLEKAGKRDPDAFRMYIYNDFFGYAIMDLVDHALSSLHTKIVKKQWGTAASELEALAIFMNFEGSYQMIDDGERFDLTNKAFGACTVKIIKALEEQGILNTDHIPNLENLLHLIVKCDSMAGDSAYSVFCKSLARRLFEDRWLDIKELEKERVDAWMATLSEEDRKELKTAMEEDEEDEDEDDDELDKDKWFGDADEDEEDEDGADEDELKLAPTWKEYKDYLRTVPTKPVKGPANWDISKWSAAQRSPFLFDNMGA